MKTRDLADYLATDEGLSAVRALQGLGVIGARAHPKAVAGTSPASILEWKRLESDAGGEQVLERSDFYRCKPKQIRVEHSGVLRVCVFGESMAAGFPLAPAYSPAVALEDELRARPLPGAIEVLDFAMPNMGPSEQLRVCEAAQSLAPDVCVFMGGNNWHYGLSVEPTAPPDVRASYARRLAEEGAGGLARAFRHALEARAAVMVRAMVEAARGAGARPIVVVPAANHAWERRNTPPWLGRRRTRAWFESYAIAEAALAAEDWNGAIAVAEQMTAIDDGLSGTPERILANAYGGLGRWSDARAAATRAIDASNWHNYSWSLPQVPSYVAAAMRGTARALDCPCVDLEAVLLGHTRRDVLDFDVFFDQCHLSIDGIRIAMSAVADALSGAAPRTAAASAAPSSAIAASAAFQGAHWTSQFFAAFDAKTLDARLQAALRNVLDRDPAFVDTLKDQIRMKSLACSPGLNAALPAAMRAPGVGAPLLSTRLNASFVSAIMAVLEARGDESIAPLVDHVIATYEAELRHGLDLARAPFRSAFWERTPLAWNDPQELHAAPIYRAPWPVSDFEFLTDGTHPLEFELVVRSPLAVDGGDERVGVVVNGARIAGFGLASRWTRFRGLVPQTALRRAVNRIRLEWPKCPAVNDDEALDRAEKRFALGADGDLFPVFGEVFSFELTSSRRLARDDQP